ncbi:MAG: hypothetical protein JSV60_02205 [Desulfobacterales bacterium]|nr:MAG: hypothetical protein JSV60_02205 [Desulfobacterales bacterium]
MATAFASYLKGNPLRAFSIRKNKKDHGIVKWIEGDTKPGDRVVIVKDVITTGGSTVKAVQAHVSSIESIVTVEDLMAVHRNRQKK